MSPELSYDFLAPPRIAFGWGRRSEIGTPARGLGRRAFLFSGSRTLEQHGVVAQLSAELARAGLETLAVSTISREPEVEDVDRATAELQRQCAGDGDLIVALGGGAAIDLAKAAAAMATNHESTTVLDYLEGVGRGLTIRHAPLPLLALPTTGGTGSEATKNAVISSRDPPFKKSLRSDMMMARVVLVDPELSVSVSPRVTAWAGLDAITQLIESYISRRARPIPRALAISGLRLAVPAIVEAVHNGSSRPAREAMAQAALFSGMALANSGLGMAHGVAAALGAHCGVPHGLACAVMLPVALRANRPLCDAALAELSRAVLGATSPSDSDAADSFVARIDSLCDQLQVPRRLSQVGVDRQNIPQLVSGSRGGSMSGNPRELGDQELADILEANF